MKIEYTVIKLPMPAEFTTAKQDDWANAMRNVLDDLGDGLWELITIMAGYGVFKRHERWYNEKL